MADKKLLIVESPAKAKTIKKYLGSKFIVEASVGHVKDLVAFRLGVDVNNNFEPKYQTIRGKGPILKKLRDLAAKTDSVLIATDPDREGEAIAWHIAEDLKTKNQNISRVLFHEITKKGVSDGLTKPMPIDENLFKSQQARRIMDRLIGYKVSPFLSSAMIKKTTESLSAGRVQSVALRLICERDAHIKAFLPIEYWSINGHFVTQESKLIEARLVSFDGIAVKNPEGSASSNTEEEKLAFQEMLEKAHFIKDEKHSKELSERIKHEHYTIDSISKRPEKRNPQAPFTTSSLQQEASKRLGFSNNKSMLIAQQLYEGIKLGDEGEVGLITYMRTDSVRLSPDAQAAAKQYIEKNFGSDFLPDKTPVYKAKGAKVQDAHEAIRPTTLDISPKEVRKHLSKDQASLYELIFNRFLASQMAPAIMDKTTVNIVGGSFIFRATDSIVTFSGFLQVYSDIKEENKADENGFTGSLPSGLKEKELLDLTKLDLNKSHTKPKPLYTESSLVKEMDELGIGRPSTYATIISRLMERKYVVLNKRSFSPTELGIDVNDVLIRNFPELFNVDFTAEMEENLDIIADGKKEYVDVLKSFYVPFSSSLDKAKHSADKEAIACEKCGAPMIIRVSRRGRFLGCSNFPECTHTQPLPKGEKEVKSEPVLAKGLECPICHSEMYLREGPFGRFYGCVNYPECKGILPLTTNVKCPKCSEGEMVEKYSKKAKKRFWGCSNYPKCDHLTNHEPLNMACPKCNYYFIEIRNRKLEGDWQKYLKCPECKTEFPITLMQKDAKLPENL